MLIDPPKREVGTQTEGGRMQDKSRKKKRIRGTKTINKHSINS